MRTCVGCGRTAAAEELLRVSLDRATDSLVVGRSLPGRGAWLCADAPDCLDQAIRRRGFDRALRTTCTAAQLADLIQRLDRTPH